MAFFDEMSKKLSQAGQTAVQKTKDVTDVARINGAIAEEERKINNNYYQIGKLYVTMHTGDCENEFAGMIAAIKESEIRIRDYRQQIQDIKGVAHCERCGAEVPNSSAFCSSCGSPMPRKTLNNENVCKCIGCGAVIDKNMRFCTSCGRPVSDSIQEVKQMQSNEMEAILYNEMNVKRKCPVCNAELEEDSIFCSECGTRL